MPDDLHHSRSRLLLFGDGEERSTGHPRWFLIPHAYAGTRGKGTTLPTATVCWRLGVTVAQLNGPEDSYISRRLGHGRWRWRNRKAGVC